MSLTSPGTTLAAIRERTPLVQNLTNLVAMDLSANLLLAVGAAPAMVQAVDEAPDFAARIADAVVINIGTLDPASVDSMIRTAEAAFAAGKPWVLDPVGVGATRLRTEAAETLLANGPRVVRGNASEIRALAAVCGVAQEAGAVRGVDSTESAESAVEAARALAADRSLVVAVTGETDYATDGERVVAVAGGSPLMPRVTALGCSLSALTAACVAVEDDALAAAAHALAILAVAGEGAAAVAQGPGSFRVALLDALYALTPGELDARARMTP